MTADTQGDIMPDTNFLCRPCRNSLCSDCREIADEYATLLTRYQRSSAITDGNIKQLKRKLELAQQAANHWKNTAERLIRS